MNHIDKLNAAYEAGWVEAACWAKRDDLMADIESPAYIADREAHLDSIRAGLVQPEPVELTQACKALSDYVHAEQCATDGQVTYSTSTINHYVFKIRQALAAAKGGV